MAERPPPDWKNPPLLPPRPIADPVKREALIESEGTTVPNDPFGTNKEKNDDSPDAKSVNKFHKKADTDSSSLATHHTLGVKNTQASPGDHLHDGVSSKQLMADITITGSKGGNAALADLITKLAAALGFTDSTT